MTATCCASAQTSPGNFERFRQQKKEEFYKWREQKQTEFEKYRQKLNDDFADMMENSWKSYNSSRPGSVRNARNL